MRNYKDFTGLVVAAFVALCFPVMGQAQEVLTEKQISLSMAQGVVIGAVEQCRADGFRVSAAVVDRSGRLKALLRDDNAGPHTIDSSRKKAFTALSFRASTNELVGLVANNPSAENLENISDDILILGGGLPIVSGGDVIGGVGVGGAPGGDLDEACARAGLDRAAGPMK
jgi:uncharacterized protein GlcG (DUF336 family)